ncbi:MAG: RNA repair domain-containing protein [Thermoplasmata archaeon]
MPTAKDVLNEIKWRDDMDFEDCVIFYVHRGVPGDFKTMKGEEVQDLGRSFIYTAGGQIPYHRVFKVEYKGETLLSRKRS